MLPENLEAYLNKIKKPIIAYMCTYMPEELILACGLHPFRIIPADDLTDKASAHLQAYVCPVGKGMLNWGLNNKIKNLKGIVVPHACDTIQKLSDIFRINHLTDFHYDLVLPVDLTKECAKDYIEDLLKNLLTELGKIGTPATEQSLKNAISLMNKVRARLRSIDRKKISNQAFYELCLAAMVMDKQEFLDATKNLPAHKITGKPVMVVGNLIYDLHIFEAFDKAGLAIVDDDICPGTRYFSVDVDEKLSPLTGITKRIVDRPVCPAKHTSQYREDYILNKVRKSSAKGVVFLYQKFCEPHLFDYPHIKDALDKEDIPHLFIEIEPSKETSHQIFTRLEAFSEMLKEGA